MRRTITHTITFPNPLNSIRLNHRLAPEAHYTPPQVSEEPLLRSRKQRNGAENYSGRLLGHTRIT